MVVLGQKSYKVCAVIAAGGSSSRMGFDKLAAGLEGESVLCRSIAAFERCGAVDGIIVVAREGLAAALGRELAQKGFSKLRCVADGGESRQQSVYNGVLNCPADTDIVCIHDGARPLVTGGVITASLEAAAKYGAATAAVPVKDTIKLGENGIIKETLPRERLYQIQTPQSFLKGLYLEAYHAARQDYSDDCQLIEAMGGQVALSEGSYDNIKLTTGGDIAIAAALLRQREGQR